MPYTLRAWQKECVDQALTQFRHGQTNFFAIATPGAGKTVMAATVACRLFEGNYIDLVICFGPSITVVDGFKNDLSQITGRSMDGGIGAQGTVLTYQNLATLPQTFWALFDRYRVFVIFDEIHHCAGRADTPSNRWGSTILNKIKHRARFSLSLSGTPWRTDNLPVVLANYCNDNGKLVCDYIYGIERAIKEKVCRIPQIIAIDHNNITIEKAKSDKSHYKSIADVMGTNDITFQTLLNDNRLLSEVIRQAVIKLNQVRRENKNAAGLIVASSVEHANRIALVLNQTFNERCTVVNYLTPDASQIINHFKVSSCKWVISVGMISEGTNIPRLQVCCYLTRIRTELYFRQVLGRVLRAGNGSHPYAYLFMVAEPALLAYAKRVADDLPEKRSILHVKQLGLASNDFIINSTEFLVPEVSETEAIRVGNTDIQPIDINGESGELTTNQTNPPKVVWSGQFLQELVRIQHRFFQPITTGE